VFPTSLTFKQLMYVRRKREDLEFKFQSGQILYKVENGSSQLQHLYK